MCQLLSHAAPVPRLSHRRDGQHLRVGCPAYLGHDVDGFGPAAVHGDYEVTAGVGDTDQMGVVYYGVYLTWFEIGRTELLRATGTTYRDVERGGFRLPVTAARIEFLKPARYDDVIAIITRVDEWMT